MIFEHGGKRFIGSRAEILEQIETAFSTYINFTCFGAETIHLGEESFPIDKIKRVLLKRIQEKVPEERVLTASVSGDEIFVYDGRGLVKRVNIYDI